LGQKIDNITLELFELLFKTAAIEKNQKLETLQTTSNKLNLLKILLRLSHDNKSMNVKTYLSLQENIQEIGKMTGGWIKYLKNS